HLKADPDLAPIPVIFYTATYSEPQAKALADSCGVRIVLPKPCDPERILAAVNEALGVADVAHAKPIAEPRRGGKAGELHKVDDQLAEYVNELQSVKSKFDDIVEGSVKLRAKRDQVRQLSEQFSENVMSLQRIASRLSAIIEVGMEMTAERNPARLVELFFAAACDIIDSKYAAIGMLDEQEQALRFIYSRGVEASIYRDADGGRAGILGALLAGHRQARGQGADARMDADELPPEHPPVRNFLGIPVASKERVYGWLYFADKRGEGGFSEEDERLAAMMAAKLAVLYENAVLYDVIQRHAAQLQVEIAERRRAEQAVRESEAKFRELIEQASDGVFVTDAEGNFKLVNPRFCEMLGYSEDALLRLGAVDTYAEEDKALLTRRLADLGDVKNRLFERMMQRKDGTLFPVEMSVRRLSNGMNQGIVRDVTDRKKALEALAESEFRFRQLTENITEVFWLTDPFKSEMLYISPAYEKIWGRSCQALYASPRDWVEAIHPEDRQRVLEAAIAKQARGDYDEEYRIVRPDGSTRWIRDRAFPVPDPEGRTYRIAGVAEDVTERKRAADKIRHLNRVYAVLSGINTLIVRARDRDELFRESCTIAVEAGQFPMAWIGLVDRETKRVKPVAWGGAAEQFLASAPLSMSANRAEGRGMSGAAISERKAMIANDIQRDPRTQMKEQCKKRGINSLVMLPLILQGEGVGVLALYAAETGFFDDEEMKLLLELAGDISFALDHIEKEEKLNYLAYYDALTGLANATLFRDRVDQHVHDAGPARRKLAVMLVDVDRFKTINDSLGRHTGDEILKETGKRLLRFCGDPGRLARVGPDDFAIVMPEVETEQEVARRTEEQLRGCFGEPFRVGDAELRISAKVGIAMFPNDGADADTLFRNAEAAVKKAKTSGERYLFYTQQMTERIAETLALESKLRQALEREEFVLHYQPKFDAETKRIEGVEALIRWQSPELGLVPPMQFIPLLEETGLIFEVGAWALRQAAFDHRRWRKLGLDAPRVAVNVSPVQLRRRDFVESVRKVLGADTGAPPIDLEITESLIMEDVKTSIEKLEEVRLLGVEVAIDDFGTGYSSLGYLAKLPVQALKIDRSFIITMLKDPTVMTLVSTIISMAHSLQLKVVAEGVDAEDQASALKRLGCDQMQGYLFSKPVDFDAITVLLGKRKGVD
ncbi:MAG TPA: EAL domain-containing protein, partial [Burkholderiales bacterium]|nr:EAL domain-containing protein [Burkholderiales bacterium]